MGASMKFGKLQGSWIKIGEPAATFWRLTTRHSRYLSDSLQKPDAAEGPDHPLRTKAEERGTGRRG